MSASAAPTATTLRPRSSTSCTVHIEVRHSVCRTSESSPFGEATANDSRAGAVVSGMRTVSATRHVLASHAMVPLLTAMSKSLRASAANRFASTCASTLVGMARGCRMRNGAYSRSTRGAGVVGGVVVAATPTAARKPKHGTSAPSRMPPSCCHVVRTRRE